MRITDIRERTIAISRYADPTIPSGGLTTSIVAIATDVLKHGRPVIGYGFASIGRYGQGGLIRERFAPRLLAAGEADLASPDGERLDPFRAWALMMAGEKPGGHGERCVAVGALDMALWDAAAKMADLPLHRFLAERVGSPASETPRIAVYAGGGYVFPTDDHARLADEIRATLDLGYERTKIKIGTGSLQRDLGRVEAALACLPDASRLAVDAMNAFDEKDGLAAAAALAPLGLWWFEDICDPHAFATQARIAEAYPGSIAAGEALFSAQEARLLAQYGGLRSDRDILVFDPVHCYGLPGFLRILEHFLSRGWPARAFWPHGGHLFSLHLVAALGLGGAEISPFAFRPFRGLQDGTSVVDGLVEPPDSPGIGFELHPEAWWLFRTLI